MADVLHDFPIRAEPSRVFEAVSRPTGIDQWWTKTSTGKPAVGAEYELNFGPDYVWRAKVTQCVPGRAFELELVEAMDDWAGTRVGFTLEPSGENTQVRFHHLGWPDATEHFRTSSFCWAMYLRILKRYVEHGEEVPYERRLDV